MTTMSYLYTDKDLGRLFLPSRLFSAVSLPGRPVKQAGEMAIFVAKQHRPVFVDGVFRYMKLLWASVTANERVDEGAVIQDANMFGTAGNAFTVIAVASAALTKAKTDLSLGAAGAHVTTNEFTTNGLSRAAGTLGTYTAPGALGGTFSRVISKSFSVTGTSTAQGAGLFDNVTVASSNLYAEDNFASSASLSSGDTLTVNATVTN